MSDPLLTTQIGIARRTGRLGLASRLMARYRSTRNQFYRSSRGYNRVSAARRQGIARSMSLQMRRYRKRPTTGIGVTEQHDSRLIYKKKSMPRGKKKKWKAFRNKVLAVSEKDLGTQQIVFNKVLTGTNTTSGNQCLVTFGLYTLKSSQTHYNDLQRISNYVGAAVSTVATGLSVDPSTKIMFQSAVLDITIRNASTNNGAPDSAARMEVDVYELTMSHTAEETGSTYDTIEAVFNENPAQCRPIGGSGTEISYALRGVTPFENSYVLSRFGIRISRKTKYQISNGDQVTYQMRDPRRHSMSFREMNNQDGFNKPNLTRLIYIVGRVAPGLTVGAIGTPGVYQEVLSVGLTRKYSFKVENWSEDRTAYEVS